MLILGIETSCDETSVSVVKDGREILSNIVSSQVKIHSKYFGVVPELASRCHLENINRVFEMAVRQAQEKLGSKQESLRDFNFDAIAFTAGPGLMGSLLLGYSFARILSVIYNKPLVPVNHLEGHIFSALLEYHNLKPPFLSLIVSGGHTELVIVEGYGKYRVLGETRDDAAGEAFDKVAKLLKLSYPGGPVIEKLAEKGNAEAIKFPRPYMWDTFEFSFSGLKTAVVYYVRGHRLNKKLVNDICASFQSAVTDTLVDKAIFAAKKHNLKNIVVCGGVSANGFLRRTFENRARDRKVNVYFPSKKLSTDNAAMIAQAGHYKFKVRSFRTRRTGLGLANFKFQIGKKKIQPPNPGLKLENWNHETPKNRKIRPVSIH